LFRETFSNKSDVVASGDSVGKLAPPLLNVHRSWPTERMEIQARPAYMSSLGLGGTEGRQHAQANPALVALFLRN
jgi:hypothetical protein